MVNDLYFVRLSNVNGQTVTHKVSEKPVPQDVSAERPLDFNHRPENREWDNARLRQRY